MTLPLDTHREDQAELLKRLLEATGDGYAMDIYETKDPRFAGILPTSWVHLERSGYLKAQHSFGNPSYELTPDGWLVAMALTHALTTRATVERSQKLLRAIKARVDRDAHLAALIDEREVAAETDLPAGWVYNALASNLLDELYEGRGYRIEYDYRSRCFRAPVTFGHPDGTGL